MGKEYIERGVAIEKTETFCDVFVTNWTDEKVLAWIKNLPTADVVEVVHGRWISDDRDVLFSCSECGIQISTSWDYGDLSWNYCPNCGAKMDGDTDREPH